MRNIFLFFATFYFLLSTSITPAYALYDPRTVPNNKIGVHVLNTSEVEQAAKLVNSSGGDWGYITVPIQPSDRDLDKWQTFMHKAKDLHLIPIIRITTIPTGGTWDSAQDTDLVDFANFLSSLDWPTQNRYIILFNEVNQSREWGGTVNPGKYTDIVKNARIIFKERSNDFFLLGPALDDSLPNSSTSLSAKNYMDAMYSHDPSIWSYFDGFATHSYPNPGFTAAPNKQSFPGITSYYYLFSRYNLSDKPVFVTETGWDQTRLTEDKINRYWEQAWSIWGQDNRVAAVTPFVLSGADAFPTLALYNNSNEPSPSAKSIIALPKIPGDPELTQGKNNNDIRGSDIHLSGDLARSYKRVQALRKLENIFRIILGLPAKQIVSVGNKELVVEVASTAAQWEKGLSDRDELQGIDGMLFNFPNYHIPVFWMKDTRFPLDILWISNNQVVEITSDVPVATNNSLPTYSPKTPVNQVLEVPAGWSKQNEVTIGSALINL